MLFQVIYYCPLGHSTLKIIVSLPFILIDHRVMERFDLEGTSEVYLVQTPAQQV